jgi:hypothetical protein
MDAQMREDTGSGETARVNRGNGDGGSGGARNASSDAGKSR